MAPVPAAKKSKAASKPKKEKIYHPSSRKAGQQARKNLRKDKLANIVSRRGQKHGNQVDFFGFFYHALPEEGVLPLEDLHGVVRDVWLKRFDDELEGERTARRKGRPKSAKETSLEDIKALETELYRTGMEVIDLTHEANIDLLRRWDQKEVAYIDMLRFIRIFKDEPERTVLSRPGKHVSLQKSTTQNNGAMDIGG